MKISTLLRKVNNIFIDILENEDVVLTYATTACDIEDWDSLNHIQLIVAIEKEFKARFTSQEILSWNNLGEMLECLIFKIP